MNRLLGFLAAIFIIFPCRSHSTIINVPGNYATIQGAINASHNGDTVLVQRGIYHTRINFFRHNILVGSAYIISGDTLDIYHTTIDADTLGTAVIFNSGETNQATLSGFTIIHGRAEIGGGVLCDSANPTIAHNIVKYNRADYGAGICCWNNSDPIISENIITQNRAVHQAGGICSVDDCQPTITNNLITANYAAESGGGLCTAGWGGPVSGNLFAFDSTGDIGGGIACDWQSRATITNNTIKKNYALRGGAGISFIDVDTDPQIFGNSIDSNSTPSNGGGILGDSECDIIHNSVFGNHAANGGGIALVSHDAYSTIDSNQIRGNSASGLGGGIFFGSQARPIIKYNNIIGNHAPDGGGIYSDSSNASIKYNVIDSNVTTINRGSGISLRNSTDSISYNSVGNNTGGSGIYLTSAAAPIISHNTIDRNSSKGIYALSSCNPIINGNVIDGNSGGINCGGWRTAVYNNIIRNNHFNQDGGGIFCDGNIPITNNIIINNSANGGGAIYINHNRPLVCNNLIYGNRASTGSAIYCNDDSSTITNTICWADTSATGGEIYLAGSANPAITYCDIMGGWDGAGNINAEPLFVDPANGDFRLKSAQCGNDGNSPCLDAGNPAYVDSLVDCDWGRGAIYCDIGAYGGGARQGSIINVPGDLPNIQSAIESSLQDDTVLVQPGVYHENIFFDGHNIVVGSLYLTTGDTSYISQTIIDGRNLRPAVSFSNNERRTAMIIGLTLINGRASGIDVWQASPTIRRNIIRNNNGGGVVCQNSNPIIENNIIKSNSNSDGGGAIRCYYSDAIIKFNRIESNSGYGGGGIYCGGSEPTILNNIISGNSTSHDGGGIFIDYSDATIINNTFSNNSAQNGGAIYIFDGNPLINNSIFWGDSASVDGDEIFQRYDTATVSYCDVAGGWPGVGNIDVNPLFRNIPSGDYHLMAIACSDSADSPCIDVGDPEIADQTLDCGSGLGRRWSDMGTYGGGNSIFSGIEDHHDISPSDFRLSQNYPNPFNVQTTISFSLPQASHVIINIFDLLGRQVARLLDEDRQAGFHQITFNAGNLTSGMYFYRIEAGEIGITKKMLLLK